MGSDPNDLSIDQVLVRLTQSMVNQEKAQKLIEPMDHKPGFWFGGGNVVESNVRVGELWLCGRYRNVGDSRKGATAGERGVACAIFRCEAAANAFDLVHYWTKPDLAKAVKEIYSIQSTEIISIEGTCLHWNESQQLWQFYISTEKHVSYPDSVKQYQKHGTGIWSIDRVSARKLEDLALFSKDEVPKVLLEPVLSSMNPAYLHFKDPFVYSFIHANGRTMNGMIFSNAPFSWSSSNTGFAIEDQEKPGYVLVTPEYVSRGSCWDVAETRISCRCAIPAWGKLAKYAVVTNPYVYLYFYDGAECITEHKQHSLSINRARGWSSEELGGFFIECPAETPVRLRRVSEHFPMFISPYGTGSCRYVSACWTSLGLFTCWQQAQEDGSQPLVYTLISSADVKHIIDSFATE